SGYNRDYLWLLARKPGIDRKIIKRFLDRSRSLGFDTDEIIFVDHSHSFNK
ncbi:MAG: lipocalin family protein, partial [Candidatus Thiodiazotropha endolucinida]